MQFGREPARFVDRRVDEARHLLEAGAGARVIIAAQPAADFRDVHLERGQRLAELVVDVAREAAALLLAHGVEPRRQLAQIDLRFGQPRLSTVQRRSDRFHHCVDHASELSEFVGCVQRDGMLADREMQARSLKRVSSSCQ